MAFNLKQLGKYRGATHSSRHRHKKHGLRSVFRRSFTGINAGKTNIIDLNTRYLENRNSIPR